MQSGTYRKLSGMISLSFSGQMNKPRNVSIGHDMDAFTILTLSQFFLKIFSDGQTDGQTRANINAPHPLLDLGHKTSNCKQC